MRNQPAPGQAVYVISVAAQLTGLHPQTLRAYERLGLVTPARSAGGGRRYSHDDLTRLADIAALTAAGIGLAGVAEILNLRHQVRTLTDVNAELRRRLAQKPAAFRAESDRTPDAPAT